MWVLRENRFDSCGIRGAHHIAPFAADAQIDLTPPPARGWKHILREFEPPDDVPPPVGSARSILTLYGNATPARATNVRMPLPLIPKDFTAGYTACADRDVNEYRQAHKSWSFQLLVNERESDAARGKNLSRQDPGDLQACTVFRQSFTLYRRLVTTLSQYSDSRYQCAGTCGYHRLSRATLSERARGMTVLIRMGRGQRQSLR